MRKMQMKGSRAIVVFILAFFVGAMIVAMNGCSIMGENVKSYSEMSPKERATYITSIYNDQYELYLREAKIDPMPEEKAKVLRQKKVLMMQLYPYIKTYNNFAEQGVFAPEDIEMTVMEIMNKLLGL